MRVWVVLVCLSVLGTAGCGHQKAAVAPAAAGATGQAASSGTSQPLIVTPDDSLQGRVVKLNSAGRFVVLNFRIGHLPAIGQRLNVYRAGLKVGEVTVTGPQLDDSVVADVSSGEAAEGDVVRDR